MKIVQGIYYEKIGSGTFRFEFNGKKIENHDSSLFDDLETVRLGGGLENLSEEERNSLWYDDPIQRVKEILN